MRILTVSDFIERSLDEKIESKTLPEIDLILSCGDIAPEYLVYLKEQLLCPLYFVKGNHDIRHDGYRPEGCVNIHGRLIRFGALRIIGIEGSMWYNGNNLQYTEQEMKKIIRSMWFTLFKSRGVDIVITHSPPRNIHDGEDLCHRGFQCFNSFIKKHTPEYFIHGHIHKYFNKPEDRVTVCGKTKIVNTCGYNIIEY